MDQSSTEPHFPNEPQQPAEPTEPELPPCRGWEGVFNEKLALWSSAILHCSWALGYLILLIADSIASDIEEAYLFGLPGIFIFTVLRFTTPFLAPLFAFNSVSDPHRRVFLSDLFVLGPTPGAIPRRQLQSPDDCVQCLATSRPSLRHLPDYRLGSRQFTEF